MEGTWIVELTSIEGIGDGVGEEMDEIKSEGEGGKKEFVAGLELKVVEATVEGEGVFLGTECLLID